jgi:predicted NUDIX family NTP pyrophosphohydrolase
MPKQTAGILMYRRRAGSVEVLLTHPGGPFWTRRDHGAWMIPKGEIDPGEDPMDAARREFHEEMGSPVTGTLRALAPIKQKSGKLVQAWAVEGDFDPTQLRSNTFQAEWPPRSGKMTEYPEVDRAEWFPIDAAREKILPAQAPLIAELVALLGE